MHTPLAAFPTCKTARLSITPLAMNDAEAVRALTDDPSITDSVHFLPSPFTRADAEALISSIDDENCFLGLWLKAELIGVIGIHSRGSDRLEIGYWIGPDFQRQGYATEAVSSVFAQLRQIHPSREIIAECRPGNDASWSLLHKLGFRSTGQPGDRPGRKLLALRQGGMGAGPKALARKVPAKPCTS